MNLTKFTKLAAAAAVLLGASTASHALLRLSITDGATATSISCTTPAACSTVGFVFTTILDVPGNRQMFFNTITDWNGWSISGTVGFSDAPGSVGSQTAQLNVSSLVVRNNSGATNNLDLSLVGTDYSIPPGMSKSISGTSTISSQSGPLTAADTILTNIYARGDNAAFGFGPATQINTCTTSGPALATVSKVCDMLPTPWTDPDAGTFSMRVFQRVTLTAGAQVKADSLMTARTQIPEPMTLSLVSVALLGAGFAARRARKA